jgi:hypothetical protein
LARNCDFDLAAGAFLSFAEMPAGVGIFGLGFCRKKKLKIYLTGVGGFR